jgi:Rrf2 family nitric oxide-sensitive transcriptional repressor
VRQTETDFRLVECFDAEHNSCNLTGRCQLKQVIQSAKRSFLAELDKVTLADITRSPTSAKAAGGGSVGVVSVGAIKRAVRKPAARG